MQAYLDRYQETLPDARQLQFCGNAAVNAVLSYFAQQAAAQQVEFSVKAQLPEYTGVADPDLAVLFGNLLENALTACMQEASPRIVVRITADAHTLCAAVDNTFTGAVRRTTGGFLSTKHAGLGLGTASVRSIAEKYRGVCDWSRETECSAPPCCWSCHRRSCEKRPPGCLRETSRRSFCMFVYSATTGASSQ